MANIYYLSISAGITIFLNMIHYMLFGDNLDLIGWLGVFAVAYLSCRNHLKENRMDEVDKFYADVHVKNRNQR